MKKTKGFLFLLMACAVAGGAQTLTVAVPNGGENWVLGSTQTISWTYAGMPPATPVKVVLYLNQDPVGIIANSLRVDQQTLIWTVGKLTGNNTVSPGSGYKVRIKALNLAGLDQSNNTFTISQTVPIRKFPEFPLPHPLPFGSPKLAITAIALVPNASGYGIIFGYKNVGNAALPPRHALTVKPDYRVLIDGREIDKGDLFVPESPVAGPGYEMNTNSGGFINFPAAGDPVPWNIGKLITITLNERNVLGMGSVSKTSSLKAIVLTVGYDLAFGPPAFDWSRPTAHVTITKVGANPQSSKEFILRWTIRGYHPAEHIEHDPTVATVTIGEGPFTEYGSKIIPSSGLFPVRLDLPMGGPYSTFYELEFGLSHDVRDEFDESNNTQRMRFNRPEVPRGPRIVSITFGKGQNAQGKDVLRTWVTISNVADHSYIGMLLVLKKNGSTLQEWRGVNIGPEQQLVLANDSKWIPLAGNSFTAYLYDSSGNVLFDAKSQYR